MQDVGKRGERLNLPALRAAMDAEGGKFAGTPRAALAGEPALDAALVPCNLFRAQVTRGRLINQFKERRRRLDSAPSFRDGWCSVAPAERTAGRSVARSLATVTLSADRATLAGYLLSLVPGHREPSVDSGCRKTGDSVVPDECTQAPTIAKC